MQTNNETTNSANARAVARARTLKADALAWLNAASKARAEGARELALGLAELCAESAGRCVIDV